LPPPLQLPEFEAFGSCSTFVEQLMDALLR
jgi:hypothetical protein